MLSSNPHGSLAGAEPAPATVDRGAHSTLVVTASATLLALAVFSIAVVTVGETVRALDGGVGAQTWALSGMSLGLAVSLLAIGALADDLGRRRVLVLSAGGLAVTSALAAVAPTMAVFVLARVLQGVAGAGLIAASLGIIGDAFPSGAARTHATGVWGAAVGGGIAVGPLAGAVLGIWLGWRSGYWLQAVAAAALVPAAARLPESRASVSRSVDVLGVATLAISMAALITGLVEGRTSWASPATIVPLVLSLVGVTAFAAVELRSSAPMLDLRLLRAPAFLASLSGALFTGLAIVGLMSYSASFYQRGLHLTVVASAVVLLAWSATSMVVAFGARRLPSSISTAVRLALGLGLAAIGLAALTGLSTTSPALRLLPGLFIAGVGSGLANAALGRLAVESVSRERASMGSGANNTARYVGGAAGVAVVVAVSTAAGGHSLHPAALVQGWNIAALVCAALCALGAAIALACGRSAAATATALAS